MRWNKTAFTLVELLVVIAIIALLLSILMPALSKVRKQAQAVTCASNIRQLNLGFGLYAEDNKGKLLAAPMSLTDPVEYSAYWFTRLGPYFGNKKYETDPGHNRKGIMEVLLCPTAKKVKNPAQEAYQTGSAVNAWRFQNSTHADGSYGLNGWAMSYTMSNSVGWTPQLVMQYPERLYVNRLQISSAVPLFYDGTWVSDLPLSGEQERAPVTLKGIYYGTLNTALAGICMDRHAKAINLGFGDGHTGKVNLKDLWMLKWNKLFKPCSDIKLPTR